MSGLTTHVLDTANGRPAADVRLELFRLPERGSALREARTNADGRCDAPLLEGADLEPGEYELVFHAGDYFKHQGTEQPAGPFLDRVVIRFVVADAEQHYHVPLLLSPYAYSTYRGS